MVKKMTLIWAGLAVLLASTPVMAQAGNSKPLQNLLRQIGTFKLRGGRSRATRGFRRQVKTSLRFVRRGRYLKAASALERAIGYRRVAVAFIAESLCYELAGKLDLAVQALKQFLIQEPKGRRARWANMHVRSLQARIASSHDVLGKWARLTSFSNVTQATARPLRYVVKLSPKRARQRRTPWHVYIQYNRANKWIMVYTTVRPKVGKSPGGVSKSVLLWMLNFDSVVQGSKLTLDKRSGNMDVQIEIPKTGANVTIIDAVVHDVFLTADSVHDKVITMMRSGRPVPVPRSGDLPTQLPGSDLTL